MYRKRLLRQHTQPDASLSHNIVHWVSCFLTIFLDKWLMSLFISKTRAINIRRIKNLREPLWQFSTARAVFIQQLLPLTDIPCALVIRRPKEYSLASTYQAYQQPSLTDMYILKGRRSERTLYNSRKLKTDLIRKGDKTIESHCKRKGTVHPALKVSNKATWGRWMSSARLSNS